MATKFKFRLEGIYKLRKEAEYEAQIALGKLRQEQYRLNELLNMVIVEQSKWKKLYNEKGMENNPETDLMMIEKYISSLENYEMKVKKAILELEGRISLAIVQVQETYKARRQIEYLKEKQSEEFYLNQNRIESRETSELNNIRFIYKLKNDAEELNA